MFRPTLYGTLGCILGIVFGVLITTGIGDLFIGLGCGILGAMIGILLNRFFALHPTLDPKISRAQMIENMISYEQTRLFPWRLLPRRARESVFAWMRSKG
jgi:hypothetical protein